MLSWAGVIKGTKTTCVTCLGVMGAMAAVCSAEVKDIPRPLEFIEERHPGSTDPSAFQDDMPYEKLIALHEVKRSPGPLDWLANHAETGQTFAEYVAEHPVIPDQRRRVIYLTLLGEFKKRQQEVVRITAEYIEIYFGLPVRFTAPVPLAVIPSSARRVHPATGDKQILTEYIIEQVLKPRIPDDAFCLIAFTASDLWPGEGWNFVFGQASLQDRIGVWSIYRNGDPDKGAEDFRKCLKRTLKTGTHEIGHMFSLRHCIYYECNMNGSNHRRESDGRPVWLCPVCLRKLIWAIHMDGGERYGKLAEFFKKQGFLPEKDFFEKSRNIVNNNH